jgi:hypothetical protein
MRTVTLEFTLEKQLEALLKDQAFLQEIAYFKPKKVDEKRLILCDTIEQHSALDSEVVVLTILSYAIKRILFPESDYNIEFISPFANSQKGGLHHNGNKIINSTTIQLT